MFGLGINNPFNLKEREEREYKKKTKVLIRSSLPKN